MDDTNFSLHLKQATNLRNRLADSIAPWLEKTSAPDLHEYVTQARQQYVATFGDPDDPEVQKEIARTCAYLERTTDELR